MKKSKLYLLGPTESILTKRGNRFPNMASFFVEQGEDLVYYTSNFYHAEKRFFSKTEIKEAQSTLNYKLKVYKVLGYYSNVSPRRVFSNFLFSLHLFFSLLFKVSKHDRILLPSRPVELIFFMAMLNRVRGVKIYLDIQDVWPDALEIENKRKKRIFEIYCNAYLRPALRHYTNTFHTAPSFKLWLERYAKNTPSEFVPLGWENKRWSTFATRQGNDSLIQMVCVAQLQHQIDVLPILEAIKDNDKFHLTIFGEDGTGERYNEVISFIEEHEMKNVEITGKIEREAMVNYLEDKDIGVLPMITSSIPNKIFDYMAAYLPILVLGKNDSSDFVINNNIGWQCNFNSEDMDVFLRHLNKADMTNKKERITQIRKDYSREILHYKIKDIIT